MIHLPDCALNAREIAAENAPRESWHCGCYVSHAGRMIWCEQHKDSRHWLLHYHRCGDDPRDYVICCIGCDEDFLPPADGERHRLCEPCIELGVTL